MRDITKPVCYKGITSIICTKKLILNVRIFFVANKVRRFITVGIESLISSVECKIGKETINEGN